MGWAAVSVRISLPMLSYLEINGNGDGKGGEGKKRRRRGTSVSWATTLASGGGSGIIPCFFMKNRSWLGTSSRLNRKKIRQKNYKCEVTESGRRNYAHSSGKL